MVVFCCCSCVLLVMKDTAETLIDTIEPEIGRSGSKDDSMSGERMMPVPGGHLQVFSIFSTTK